MLEFPDRWTGNSVGVVALLERAGMRVAALDLDAAATAQRPRPDLIAFGSFTNNDAAYREWIERFGASLADFVAAGGVVLEMTQSDQFGASVAWLPRPLAARRGDRDLATVRAVDPEHPLVAPWWPADADALDAAWFDRKHPNWEGFEEQRGMRVLLASEPDGAAPCLLEGAHGRGRVVVSSLWIDKCFGPDAEPSVSATALDRGAAFFAAVAAYVDLVAGGRASAVVPTPRAVEAAVGPMIGHVDAESARIWFRPGEAERAVDWVCAVRAADRPERQVAGRATADRDHTIVFDVAGLTPDTEHAVELTPAGADRPAATASFRTAPGPGLAAKVVLGLGSCAPSTPSHVWTRIVDEGCDGFVFLGDTPYVDSTDLDVARAKHRRFLSQPEIARMVAAMPCWGTWDDHDFGKNDGHGDFAGKHACRRAFVEYRANATFGHGPGGRPETEPSGDGEGVYTSFRRGPLEVFLIDPRWFSRTEPSFADPDQPTCIGATQWQWLQRRLRASTATFKALATGMIWDDKQNREQDDWHTYRHEREAIFDFVRDRNIDGVFLIGGDIHVSRALNYGPRVGYDLWQFIVSPLHDSVIPSLDVPHAALVHHALEPHTFLKLVCDATLDDPRLDAIWMNRDGTEHFRVTLRASGLRAR